MTVAVVLFLAGFVYGVIVIFAVGVCVAAGRADRLADRLLGPASSDLDFEFGLLLAMDDDPTPHGRRHG